MLSHLDSHDLKNLLLGQQGDTDLLFKHLHQQQMKYDAMATTGPSSGAPLREEAVEDAEEVEEVAEEPDLDNPFDTPFANDFLDGAKDVYPHAYSQEQNGVFADRFDGAFTHAEQLSIQVLLAILRHNGAPNYVYGEIMDIMMDALHHNVYLTSTFLDHSLILNHLA
jgi:hypothetical protein